MADLQAYYAKIKNQKQSLDERHSKGYLYTTSVTNLDKGTTPGTVAQVSTRVAAEGMVNKTSRESTPAEIQEHLHQGEQFAITTNAMEQQNKEASLSTVAFVQGPA